MRLIALALGGVCLAGGAFAQDADAGRKVAGMCRTCHGIDGFAKIPIAPHIGGEPEGYIRTQLQAFRSGTRTHEMMSVVASGLSDQQIMDVAAWYATQTITATLPEAVTEDDAPEVCASCHGIDGIALTEDTPNLAGETNIYIETQLKAFRIGKRTHEIMSEIAAELTDAEMRELANWYAGVTLEIAPPE